MKIGIRILVVGLVLSAITFIVSKVFFNKTNKYEEEVLGV